ncbi:ester cyclase [Rhizobium sp. SSA_523]|uniref:nuclear transport factor 2 family protein n=1 Tax=Rhizobium sp. SSA_523 TaxID=2952477 RepID=UPI0020901629|nr:ester cyclase [Rhizobium sp. SSA_523]MCO5733347.1 ester cyclase [Rhizobium sp. SSA_523]WKC21674.1 ester cyclase [Rhizobium sp. SSA_523]
MASASANGAGPSSAQRRAFLSSLQRLAEARPEALADALSRTACETAEWRVAHPINALPGNDAALSKLWTPLKAAFPDLERRDTIFVGGSYEGRDFIAAVGHYCGTMRGDWLGIPATHKTVYLRYGEVWQIDADGRAIQANLLWDVLDVMRQAGVWPLAPSLGVEELWPGPITADGVRLELSPARLGETSIAQTLAMHKTLMEHDDRNSLNRQSLIDMPQREHWHEKMMWYGPAGIGTTRGLDGFVDGHQLPFRIAFHRPQGTHDEVMAERQRHGAGHYIRIGDGPYSVTGGWPSVYAMHKGGDFCGLPPSGKPVFMRVMDFYLHHEGLIRENWVPLDMLHLLFQMGVDPLARMRALLRQ